MKTPSQNVSNDSGDPACPDSPEPDPATPAATPAATVDIHGDARVRRARTVGLSMLVLLLAALWVWATPAEAADPAPIPNLRASWAPGALTLASGEPSPETSPVGATSAATTPIATAAVTPAEAEADEAKANPVRLGPDGLPEERRQLPDLGRLERQLRQEAMIESFLGASDRRHLVAVRAYVDRTGRVPNLFLQDHHRNFDDSRRTVQQTAKEAMREYVKMRVGWDSLQDRMKVRVRSLFRRDRAEAPPEVSEMASVPGPPEAYESGFGAIGVGPEVNLDMDDAEIGLDFDYDPGRTTFLSRWEMYYGYTMNEGKDELRLRYNNGDEHRWLELRAGRNDREVGSFVSVSFTALF